MSIKLKVSTDEQQFEKTVRTLEDFIKGSMLETLKTEFENLKFKEFTNEVFIDIKENKSENVIKEYYEHVNKELDKIGVINELSRTNILKGHESTVHEFKGIVKNLFENLTIGYEVVNLKHIEYKKGRFIIPKNELEQIKENCTYYLETKNEVRIYDSLNKLLDATIEFKKSFESLIGYELPENIKTNDLIKDYFIKEFNGQLTLEPRAIRTVKNKFKTK